MAHMTLRIFSEALKMQTQVEIVLPQQSTVGEIGTANKKGTGKLKCLYLLHGLSDDQSIWMRRTSIERYAAQYGICVVMPTGARSFYEDMKYGMKYYTYIAKELPAILGSMLPISTAREDTVIGGLSMGGYGAIKMALREQGRYGAAFGLSPVTRLKNPRFAEVLLPVFGDEIPEEAELSALASVHEGDMEKPRLYLTIGKDDFMYRDCQALVQHMEGLGYDFTYVETQGGHSWELWDSTVQAALAWAFGK